MVRYEAAPAPAVTSRRSPSQSWIVNWRVVAVGWVSVPRVRVMSVRVNGPASPASTLCAPDVSSNDLSDVPC